MNGRGTGLLKSKTGKPEGPYEDLGRITAIGGSPSLFVEGGRAPLWLWGDLMVAELNPDRTALVGTPESLYLQIPSHYIEKVQDDVVDMWDDTAPHLFTAVEPKSKKTKYYLTWSAISQGTARALRDTFIARADSPMGPYTSPVLMIPHGGQISVFEGPEHAVSEAGAKGGPSTLYASFYGADPSATFRDRPGIVPLEFGYHDMPRKVNHNFYARRGPWNEPLPVPDGMTDYRMTTLPDGMLYLGWSSAGRRDYDGGVDFWRSADGKHWELLEDVYTHAEGAADPNWPAGEQKPGWMNHNHPVSWANGLYSIKGDIYLLTHMHNVPGKDWQECPLLKSVSGKPEGPYKAHVYGFVGNVASLTCLFEDGGGVYGTDQGGNLLKLTDDLKAVDTEWIAPLKKNGFDVKTADGTIKSTDIPGLIGYGKIGGKYLWGSLNGFRGYCGRFWISDNLVGPLRELGTLPYMGNGMIARSKAGVWFAAFQYMHQHHMMSAPTQGGTPIQPAHLELDGDDPHIVFEYDRAAGVRELSVY
jgi:hypothetical protein